MIFRRLGSALRWFGGANEKILDDVPEERPAYTVGGVTVLLIPLVAAIGMSLRIESMVGIPFWQALLTAGVLTYLLVATIEVALVRNLKNPMPAPNLPDDVSQAFTQQYGVGAIAVTDSVINPRKSRLSSFLIDVLRILMAAAVGMLTTHALLEYLYQDDINEAAKQELATARERLENTLLGTADDQADGAEGAGDESTEATLAEAEEAGVVDGSGVSLVDKYGPWVLQGGSEVTPEGSEVTPDITPQRAWDLLRENGDLPETTATAPVRNQITRLEGEVADIDAEITGLSTQIKDLNKDINEETTTGQGGVRRDGCGRVCEDLKDEREVLQGEREGLRDMRKTLTNELDTLNNNLSAQLEPSEDDLADARSTVLRAWAEYRRTLAFIDEQTTFDESDLGVAERSTKLFEVVFASPGAAVIGIGLIVALFFVDILPYTIKRFHPRAHDTRLALRNAGQLLSWRAEYINELDGAIRREAALMRDLGHTLEGTEPPPPAETASPPPSSSTPNWGQGEPPPGWTKERILNATYHVDREHPIRSSQMATVYRALRYGHLYLFKEPSRGSKTSPVEPEMRKRQLEAMRIEIRQYQDLRHSPRFPRMERSDEDRGLLVLEFKERMSIDNFLFGYISVTSDSTLPSRVNVTAEAIVSWLRHLLAGAEVLWDSGIAFVDGHPSNTVIEGAIDDPVFDGPPLEVGHRSAGYLKLVDLGSSRKLNARTDKIEVRMAYQPPEYQPGRLVPTIKGDVYSVLGGVGYYLLTGSDPTYRGEVGKGGTLVPPYVLNADVPPALSRLVEQFLSPRPDDRLGRGRALDSVQDQVDYLKKRIDMTVDQLRSDGQLSQLVLRQGEVPTGRPGSWANNGSGPTARRNGLDDDEPTEEIRL